METASTPLNVGEKIRAARKKMGLSQQNLADLAGLSSHSVVSRYENNEREPGFEILGKFSRVLNRPVSWFFLPDEKPRCDTRIRFRILGRRIKAARKRAGLTQLELAQKLGVVRETIASYESGRYSIPIDKLEVVAETVGCPVADLVAHTSRAPSSSLALPGRRRSLPDTLGSWGLVGSSSILLLTSLGILWKARLRRKEHLSPRTEVRSDG